MGRCEPEQYYKETDGGNKWAINQKHH
jgi:hypothetical protein